MNVVRIICGLALVLLTLSARAEIQRWVDERGVVHYGDKIPPEYLGRGSVQLNNQGVRVKEKSRAMTESERQQAAEVQNQQKDVARQRQEQLRRDRSLIDTYASLDEIKRVRDRALESLDNAINITQIRLTEVAKQKVALDGKLQHKMAQKQFIKLSAERDTFANEIRHLNDILFKRQQERKQTEQRYAADMQRYKEITNYLRQARNPSSSQNTSTPSTTPAPLLRPATSLTP